MTDTPRAAAERCSYADGYSAGQRAYVEYGEICRAAGRAAGLREVLDYIDDQDDANLHRFEDVIVEIHRRLAAKGKP